MAKSETERLVSLEERYCHQERIIEQLSQVLHDQQLLIDRLSRDVARLSSQMGELCDVVAVVPPNEKPPHY